MKLIETKCPSCGAILNVDADKKQGYCQYCGTKYFVDDEVKRIKYDDAEDAGYQFEKGRLRAQAEFMQNNTPVQPQPQPIVQQPVKRSGARKFWRVVGLIILWLYFFPIMLTITIVKSKKLKRPLKIIFVSVIWISIILFFALNLEEKPNDVDVEDDTSVEVGYVETYNEDLFI